MFHKDIKIMLGPSCATYERGADSLKTHICQNRCKKLEDQNKNVGMQLIEKEAGKVEISIW
jgi:hypothetical protein